MHLSQLLNDEKERDHALLFLKNLCGTWHLQTHLPPGTSSHLEIFDLSLGDKFFSGKSLVQISLVLTKRGTISKFHSGDMCACCGWQGKDAAVNVQRPRN